MGNFSISHYAGIRIDPAFVELRYILDMAEIPTFQEMQQTGIRPQANSPELDAYLERKAEALRKGLVLELDGQALGLQLVSRQVIFPPGAGGLPTMKLGFLFRATLAEGASTVAHRLDYRDGNFPERAGWKEVVAQGAVGVILTDSSAPQTDRSDQLSNYPTDLLNSPPQVLEASVSFKDDGVRVSGFGVREDRFRGSGVGGRGSQTPASGASLVARGAVAAAPPESNPKSPSPESRTPNPAFVKRARLAAGSPQSPNPQSRTPSPAWALEANKQGTPRSAFTDLLARKRFGFWFLLSAALIAATLGAFHALEPGHGKTIVAAYLVGSRGTATHACLLGLIVTASHTAGVYLLGLVTLYASTYIVPEHLYPWLGALSGVTIAGLGLCLFVRRSVGSNHHAFSPAHGHSHHHPHPHHNHPNHQHFTEARNQKSEDGVRGSGLGARAFASVEMKSQKSGAGGQRSEAGSSKPETKWRQSGEAVSGASVIQAAALPLDSREINQKSKIQNPKFPNFESLTPNPDVSYRGLLALGVTGGIVPFPAALGVLLSAVALRRVAFGLFLILAFSIGLAAVLIVIGLLMVYAGRFMSRLRGEGPLLTRWLPMASAAVITLLGLAIALRALAASGVTAIRI
jgi:ABC-type nickel/cobalt efflux system permease component RcnA